MASRLKLQEEFVNLFPGKKVYFQPPESLKLEYPCVIYELSNNKQDFADDSTYLSQRSYTVTIIDRNPDSILWEIAIKHFEMCSFNRYFVSNNLNHYVLNLYY